MGKDGRSEVLLALSIGPFEVTRLRLAGDGLATTMGFRSYADADQRILAVHGVVDGVSGVFELLLRR